MGTRQPAQLSRPVYGLPEGTAPSDLSRAPSPLLPLLLLFVVLAAASVWFVALPAFAIFIGLIALGLAGIAILGS